MPGGGRCNTGGAGACRLQRPLRLLPQVAERITTKLGWKLPDDPFSGKALIYKPRAKGFVIYSIGPNMKDNGGVLPRRTRTSRPKAISSSAGASSLPVLVQRLVHVRVDVGGAVVAVRVGVDQVGREQQVEISQRLPHRAVVDEPVVLR